MLRTHAKNVHFFYCRDPEFLSLKVAILLWCKIDDLDRILMTGVLLDTSPYRTTDTPVWDKDTMFWLAQII